MSTFPNYEQALKHLYEGELPRRVYHKIQEIMADLISLVSQLTPQQAIDLLKERGVEDRHFYIEAEKGTLLDYTVLDLLDNMHSYAIGRDSIILLLEDLYNSIKGDDDMLALLQLQDPTVVLYQDVEVTYQQESSLITLHEETLAALALMSRQYGANDVSFFFPISGEKLADRALADEFQRHNDHNNYAYKIKLEGHLSYIWREEITYWFDDPAFLQGVNTFLSWAEIERPYQVYLLEKDGSESMMSVL